MVVGKVYYLFNSLFVRSFSSLSIERSRFLFLLKKKISCSPFLSLTFGTISPLLCRRLGPISCVDCSFVSIFGS